MRDLDTGCDYALNPGNRQRTASVFKVMVLAGTLLEAQSDLRQVTETELGLLLPMITESANEPVRALWRSFGGSPWFARTGATLGLDETSITADGGSAWGATRTSASDQVDLLGMILLGDENLFSSNSMGLALDLMTSVVDGQTWGVTAGVPRTWQVAQKNGFAGQIINSVGWADPPGAANGYLVAILSDGWPDHPSGIAAVEFVSLRIAEAMVDRVTEAR